MSVIVENLCKFYDGKHAIQDVSFRVDKGEVLGFLGSNGAGKTTTMKILACFIPQSSGNASVCGFDVVGNPQEVKKRIGYLPEHNPLYGHMYIPEFLNFIAGLHQIPNKKDRIEELVNVTGLMPEINKKIAELSKGYRQRVGLAQAMIHDPEVLILDEPTSGLDPTQLKEMRRLIRKLGEEKTVIFSSHIMQEIEAVCDRAIIIHKGHIKLNERIDSLPGDKNDQQWIIHFNKAIAIGKVNTLDSVEMAEKIEKNGFIVSGNNEKFIKKEVFELAANEGAYITELRGKNISLEDLFLRHTQD